MIRVLIAVTAIGLMSLSAFAQAPEQNEGVRNAAVQRLISNGRACVKCDLFQVNLSYKELEGRDLSGSYLQQADLSLASFDGSKLAGANLSASKAYGARFVRTDFSGANLSGATLAGSWFGGAVMTGADLRGANLSGSYLFTAKGLTQDQLSTACGDEATKLPQGLTIPLCPGAEPRPQLRGLTR